MAGFLAGNRGKLLLVGVLLVGAVFLVYRQFRNPARLPDSVNFVCVVTGETYWIGRHDYTRLPTRNPKTGQMTLVPCYEKGGVLHVSAHHRASLLELGDKNHYVDPETLTVQTSQ